MEADVRYPDRREFEKRYTEMRPALEAELESLEKKLRELLEREGIAGSVKGRVKSFDSYYNKLLQRFGDAGNTIRDLVGVRILTPFLDSVDRIEHLVRGGFPVLEVERKGEEQSFREFGYRSVHLNLELPSGTPCEVQIRTILQDAWAEVEHELVYKGTFSPFDEPLKRKLAALNATLSLSDIIFQEIRDYQRRLNRELRLRRENFGIQVERESAGPLPAAASRSEALPADDPGSMDDPEMMDDLDQALLKALQIHNSGGYAEAVALYTRILSGNPPPEIRSLTLVHRGMARFGLSDYRGAEEDFVSAAAFREGERRAHWCLGMLYRASGRHRESLESFRRLLESDPYSVEALTGAARALFDGTDYAAAVEYCDRGLKIAPDSAGLLRLRQEAVRKLGF